MEGNEIFLEGFKALTQIGMSAVFIAAWWNERQTNKQVVKDYFNLREMQLKIEHERIKLEYAQFIGRENMRHLTKTEIPDIK